MEVDCDMGLRKTTLWIVMGSHLKVELGFDFKSLVDRSMKNCILNFGLLDFRWSFDLRV